MSKLVPVRKAMISSSRLLLTSRRRWPLYAIASALILISLGIIISVQRRPANNNIIASCAVVAGGSISSQIVSVTCGPSRDEIRAIVSEMFPGNNLPKLIDNFRARGSMDADVVAKLAAKLRLTPEQISGVIKALSTQIVLPSTAPDQFADVTSNYIAAAVAINALPVNDTRRQQAEAALESGDIAGARRLLPNSANKTVEAKHDPKMVDHSRGDKGDDERHIQPSLGGITRIFTNDECSFWLHPCNIELGKVYGFRSSSLGQQPGFKLEVGARTVHLHYQYVRGALVTGDSDPPPEKDICNPNIYWELLFPHGPSLAVSGAPQVEIPSCNFIYKVFVPQGFSQTTTGFMISIRQFFPPKGSGETSDHYFGENFNFSVTK